MTEEDDMKELEAIETTPGHTTFNPDNHIVGKVYSLTQDNMNAMIEEIERLQRLVRLYEG